jgi:ElaB/YqjD/DUF883 family membrane-anchored ribosome-binding protein
MSRTRTSRTKGDLKEVVETAEQLLTSLGNTGSHGMEDLKAKAQETIAAARSRLEDATGRSREAAAAAVEEADAYVHSNPWIAVAIAGAVGAVLGAALIRRN